MKLTIVGLRDRYIRQLQSNLQRHGLALTVLPQVIGDHDRKDPRHTVTLEADRIDVTILDHPDPETRVAGVFGDGWSLRLWGFSFHSMYLR